MSRFVEGEDRRQPALLPSCLDDYVGEDNPARVVDVFVDELDLANLGFEVTPAATGRPAYHPAMLLKLYIYGYLNRVPSSRRLEREAGRNVELMWLTGKLAPDRRTPLRHDQGLDGTHPLPDEAAAQREDRDQPPCPGLQSEARDADPRRRPAHRRHPSLRDHDASCRVSL